MKTPSKKLLKNIKLLLMDCDGVLTDGRLYFTEKGETIKVFHVRDGQGLVSWRLAGFESGIISGRSSPIVAFRAAELGINYIKIGSKSKIQDFQDILRQCGLTENEVAYIGDDTPDIPLMKIVGFPIAVADAVAEVKAAAKYVTTLPGGYGAVRQVIDLILETK